LAAVHTEFKLLRLPTSKPLASTLSRSHNAVSALSSTDAVA